MSKFIIEDAIMKLRNRQFNLRQGALWYNRRSKAHGKMSVRSYNCLRESAKITVALLALQYALQKVI